MKVQFHAFYPVLSLPLTQIGLSLLDHSEDGSFAVSKAAVLDPNVILERLIASNCNIFLAYCRIIYCVEET